MIEAGDTEKRWLVRLGIKPRKRLGQNFLIHPRGAQRLAGAMPLTPEDAVLEIGAGGGALTAALLDRGCRVWAVEIDPRLGELLTERFRSEIESGRLTLIAGDALNLKDEDLERIPGPLHAAGNLPYYATTPILLWCLAHRSRLRTASFLVQREFADRITAAPGSRTYGSLTVWIAYHAVARRLLTVAPGSFWPVPEVQSALVSLAFHDVLPHPLADPADLEQVLAWTFQHRRKMLRASLASALGGPATAHAALERAGIDPLRRPETLGLEEFVRLAAAVAEARR